MSYLRHSFAGAILSVHAFPNALNGRMIPPFQGGVHHLVSPDLPFSFDFHTFSRYNQIPVDLFTSSQRLAHYRWADTASYTGNMESLELITDCMGQPTGYCDHRGHYFYLLPNAQKGMIGRSLLTLFSYYPYLLRRHSWIVQDLSCVHRWASSFPPFPTKFEHSNHLRLFQQRQTTSSIPS